MGPCTSFSCIANGAGKLNYEILSKEIDLDKVLIVFAGSSPGLTRKELDLGQPVFIRKTYGNLSAVAELAITLDHLDFKISTKGSKPVE